MFVGHGPHAEVEALCAALEGGTSRHETEVSDLGNGQSQHDSVLRWVRSSDFTCVCGFF